jgi:L-threonylcarbamoyladenylate synthase
VPTEDTEVIPVDPQEPEPEAIQRAADVIRQGGLVVLPTDTVYGLVCDPGQPAAIDRIYQVKGRRRDLPLALLLHDMAQVSAMVEEVPEAAVRAMQQFWPGPLTVVLRDRSPATAAVRAGKDTIGLRLPAHVVPRLVADIAEGPLASTSANRTGQPAPATAEQALQQLAGLAQLLLDSGPAPGGRESTVLSFATDPPRILREGALPERRLREVLGELQAN